MSKPQQKPQESTPANTEVSRKYKRFQDVDKVNPDKKSSWPAGGVIYIGHLPHGFYQDQLKSYFSQYGEVLGVKVARARKTARSKGYAFIQFRYPEVANIVSETMNGYMLFGKVLVSHVLPENRKNPFSFSTSKSFKFVDWKRLFVKTKNRVKTSQQTKKEVEGLLKNEAEKREKLKVEPFNYQYPGFASFL